MRGLPISCGVSKRGTELAQTIKVMFVAAEGALALCFVHFSRNTDPHSARSAGAISRLGNAIKADSRKIVDARIMDRCDDATTLPRPQMTIAAHLARTEGLMVDDCIALTTPRRVETHGVGTCRPNCRRPLYRHAQPCPASGGLLYSTRDVTICPLEAVSGRDICFRDRTCSLIRAAVDAI